MAAPNQCEILARVLHIEPSPTFPDKSYLELEILESKNVAGPNFARAGDRVTAFTFQIDAGISEGKVISALAEYLGDVRGGQFQLTRLVEPDSLK